MQLLIALRSIRSGNELLRAGDKFLIEDGQGLIERGYARRLTQSETRAILDDYIQCTKKLFTEEPEKKTITQERATTFQGSLF
jgi:hypothetical protein